jgi:hypothetical protein
MLPHRTGPKPPPIQIFLTPPQLEELGELEPAILENAAKLNMCDVLCYTYDSSDPNSFAHIENLRVRCPS